MCMEKLKKIEAFVKSIREHKKQIVIKYACANESNSQKARFVL